ncbi:hypothetical protein HW532_20890 [Kaustia mangrovi]|uniref:Phage tail protein n=1 Tax=Kaustia mangrovi TaxID=2593653 RepID=A0A7S8HDL6_9HYPH|nr:portal protein [Kaustia mangrovi]QPC44937.1 hypothetical protein HW532_20890 [Kaustia mangrovi]
MDTSTKTKFPEGTLAHRWDTLHNEKSSLLTRAEQYAKWTLPHVFPEDNQNDQTELPKTVDSLGARGVNHMANRVITTLFRPQGAFFRLHIGKDQEKQIGAMSQDPNRADVGRLRAELDGALADAEQEGVEYLDMVSYRPSAINAAKLLLITGNALIYHPKGKPVQVYSLRNYCVVRDISGNVIEIVIKESKAFETFSVPVQIKLRETRNNDTPYEDRTDVCIYTQIKLNEDGKFEVKQAADLVDISKPDMTWPRETLPWVPLTWNLVNGEDYGRGLVEDYAGAFHALEILNGALLNMAAIMGDIKFFVNPASVIDVQALNESEAGSYHSGKAEDVGTAQLNKQADAQFIASMIDRYEKQIAQGFLLNSAVTRDAERVTAEEIRMQAQELDTSNGGVYSRLANQWQVPTARIILDHTKFPFEQFGIKLQIITGMDSLSRMGELDNLRMFIGDMALLDGIPEDFRRAINPIKYAAVVGKARQVDYTQFLYTQAEMQQQQEQEMQRQNQLEQQKAAGTVAAEAGKAAVQQEN